MKEKHGNHRKRLNPLILVIRVWARHQDSFLGRRETGLNWTLLKHNSHTNISHALKTSIFLHRHWNKCIVTSATDRWFSWDGFHVRFSVPKLTCLVFTGGAGRRLKIQGELKKGQAYNSLGTLYHSKKHIEVVMYRLRSNRQRSKEVQERFDTYRLSFSNTEEELGHWEQT